MFFARLDPRTFFFYSLEEATHYSKNNEAFGVRHCPFIT